MSDHDAIATAAAEGDIVGASLRDPIPVKSFSAARKRQRAQPSALCAITDCQRENDSAC
jgi:hypothetical protein